MKANAKISKEHASYRSEAPTAKRHCETCSMFKQPNGCTLVRGSIQPGGTCRFWERRR